MCVWATKRDFLDRDCQGCPRQPGLLGSFGIHSCRLPPSSWRHIPAFSFINFAGVGDGGYYPDILADRVQKFEDTLTKIVGKHTIVLGGDFNFWQTPRVEDPMQVNGSISFNGQFSSLAAEIPGVSAISDLADLELGFPSGGLYTQKSVCQRTDRGRLV